MELDERNLPSARVHLAAGLPLTWVSVQKEGFRNYLLQQEEANFTFKGEPFHVEFDGADIYPQGFSAVGAHLMDFTGTTMLCDIGSGTISGDICATAKGYEALAAMQRGRKESYGVYLHEDAAP